MSSAHTHRASLACVIPPYVLEGIVRNGSDEERDWALQTLTHDASIRQYRAVSSLSVEAGPAEAGLSEGVTATKNRKIYTTANSTTLPGTLVRSEGQAAGSDVAVNEAYDGLGDTFDLYWEVFGRNSIDNAGMALLGTDHYGSKYNNAFWNGTQMVFGDGDGVYFNRFTISIDVMGHELTHGVTAHQANLEYHDQPGALNESISDVFGSMVKQYAHSPRQTAAAADWLIGQGLFTSAVNGVALRSMKAPGTAYDDKVLGKDPQPADMAHYVNTTGDNGGVHINSGIPNRAFYLAAVGLGGYSWERAGKIWYTTLCDARLSAKAQFQDFANLTTDNAGKLFGSAAADVVAGAWRQVGINVSVSPITGNWVLHYDWSATGNYSQVPVTFNSDGSLAGGLAGQWRFGDGTLLLSFTSGPAKYAGTVCGSVGTGEMSTYAGLDGTWYLTKQGMTGILDQAAGGTADTRQELDPAGNTTS